MTTLSTRIPVAVRPSERANGVRYRDHKYWTTCTICGVEVQIRSGKDARGFECADCRYKGPIAREVSIDHLCEDDCLSRCTKCGDWRIHGDCATCARAIALRYARIQRRS